VAAKGPESSPIHIINSSASLSASAFTMYVKATADYSVNGHIPKKLSQKLYSVWVNRIETQVAQFELCFYNIGPFL
jgi:hypothetical protein